MSLFKKNKNRRKVENSHCSMGLLQQTMRINSFAFHKQLLDEVFVISRIIKVEVTETLIILDITKTESNCFIIHSTKK